MSAEQSPQGQPSAHETKSFLQSKTDYGVFFVGITIGNLIGDELFETDFSPVRAPLHAAIALGIIFGAKKVGQHLKS